jgi:hypothetical protein
MATYTVRLLFLGVFFITFSILLVKSIDSISAGMYSRTNRSARGGGSTGGTEIGSACATTGHEARLHRQTHEAPRI